MKKFGHFVALLWSCNKTNALDIYQKCDVLYDSLNSKAQGLFYIQVYHVHILNASIEFFPFPSGKSKEAEIKRINKELANIRSKFKGDKALDGYSKKKYVCKLLFIFLLGHDIDFGHMEAVNLLSSNKYTEKQIVSVLMF